MKNEIPSWFICAVLFALVLSLSGCFGIGGPAAPKSAPAKVTTAQLVEQQLNLAGVPNAHVTGEGSTVTVSYDPADVNYEGQIVSNWGAIFGVLSANYPNADRYVIVQLFDGSQVAQISSSSADVRAMNSGQISVNEFKKRMVFKGGNGTS